MKEKFAALAVVALAMAVFFGASRTSAGAEEEPKNWRGHEIRFEGAVPTQDNPWGTSAGIIKTDEEGQCLLLTPKTAVTLYGFKGGELELDLRIHPWVSKDSDGAAVKVTYLNASEEAMSEGTLSIENDQRVEYIVDMAQHPGATHVRLMWHNLENHGVDNDWIIIGSPVVETEPEDWQGIQTSFLNAEPTGDNPWGTTAGIIDTDEDGRCLLLTPDTGAVLRELDGTGEVRLAAWIHPWVTEHSDGAGLKVLYLDDQENAVSEEHLILKKDQRLKFTVTLVAHPGATHVRLLSDKAGIEDAEGDWIVIGMLLPETEPEDWEGIQASILNAKATEDNPWGTTAGIIDTDEDGRCLFLTPNTGAVLKMPKEIGTIRLVMRIHPWVAEVSDGAGLRVCLLDDGGSILYEEMVLLDNSKAYIPFEQDLTAFPGTTQIELLCNNGSNDDGSGDWVIVRLEA